MIMYKDLLKKQQKIDLDEETSGINIANLIQAEDVPKLIEKLPHQQEVLGKIKKLRINDGKKDISGSNLHKIEEFIEKGNISHLSMEEVSCSIILQLKFFTFFFVSSVGFNFFSFFGLPDDKEDFKTSRPCFSGIFLEFKVSNFDKTLLSSITFPKL